MKAQPLDNGILFVFKDTAKHGMFEDVSDLGIILGRDKDSSAQQPRWIKVVAVGPDVKDESLKPGAVALVEPLMWTKGIVYDGIEIWKTDESKIMMVQD